MAIKLRKKSKKESWAKGREKFLKKKARKSEKFSKKQDRVQTRLERQEDRVAKTMAKRDIRKLKKGKDVKGKWVDVISREDRGVKTPEPQTVPGHWQKRTKYEDRVWSHKLKYFNPDSAEKRVRDAGPLAFKKKKLIKLRDKAGKMAKDEAWKNRTHSFRGGNKAREAEGDVRMESADRLKEKKKSYRKKKGY